MNSSGSIIYQMGLFSLVVTIINTPEGVIIWTDWETADYPLRMMEYRAPVNEHKPKQKPSGYG